MKWLKILRIYIFTTSYFMPLYPCAWLMSMTFDFVSVFLYILYFRLLTSNGHSIIDQLRMI